MNLNLKLNPMAQLPLNVLIIISFVIQGCSSGMSRKLDFSRDLSQDLPQDLKAKFEIKDSQNSNLNSEPLLVASPPAMKSNKSKIKHSKKKKNWKKSSKNSLLVDSGIEKDLKTKEPTVLSTQFVYPTRRPKSDPIWVGERFTFNISYLNVSAGEFVLEVLPFKTIGERKVYHIRGTAISSPVFSLFYRLNDVVESFMDYEGLFSHRFHLLLDESKQTRDSIELNDSEKKQTFFWNRLTHKVNGFKEVKQYGSIEAFPQDSLSSLFYLRTIPLPTVAEIVFPVANEGKSWDAICEVVGREQRDTPLGKVQTVKIKPRTRYQGVIQQKNGDSFIWLTDDDRRIPVYMEAKVKIGSIAARLKKVSFGTAPIETPEIKNP